MIDPKAHIARLAKAVGRLIKDNGLTSVDMVGEVAGSVVAHVPQVDDPEFGNSNRIPSILEIRVDHKPGKPANVGQIVKQALFPNHPYFMFNVCFACADSNPLTPGRYADPTSIWFNVFFGYYEIDVPKGPWRRPFGYTSADPVTAQIDFEDVARIGKADWNYFSNYLYGVPLQEIIKHDGIDMDSLETTYHRRQQVGQRSWDLVELSGIDVVSAYVTDPDKLLKTDPLLTPFWRFAFGKPSPQPSFDQNFMPTPMRGKFYMSFKEEYDSDLKQEAYKTFFFGGTVNGLHPDQAANERFLELQLAAVREVMADHYDELGFR